MTIYKMLNEDIDFTTINEQQDSHELDIPSMYDVAYTVVGLRSSRACSAPKSDARGRLEFSEL